MGFRGFRGFMDFMGFDGFQFGVWSSGFSLSKEPALSRVLSRVDVFHLVCGGVRLLVETPQS